MGLKRIGAITGLAAVCAIAASSIPKETVDKLFLPQQGTSLLQGFDEYYNAQAKLNGEHLKLAREYKDLCSEHIALLKKHLDLQKSYSDLVREKSGGVSESEEKINPYSP